MNRHSFSLSSIGMSKGRAQVKLDGEDISDAVQGIGLDFSARDHPRVMLELSGVSADVAVDDAEIQLPVKVVELLGRLGWMQPEDVQTLAMQFSHDPDDVPTSDDAPGDAAAGGIGPVIT